MEHHNNTIYKCEICGYECESIYGFVSHIGQTHCKTKEYYDKYLKKDDEGICVICGNSTKFKNIIVGYEKYCSICKKRIHYENVRKSVKNKYGVNNISQLEKIKQQKIDTYKKHYGVDNPLKNNNIKEKQKQTMIDRFGVKNPSQSSEIKEKKKQTLLKRYGVPYYFMTDAFKNTISMLANKRTQYEINEIIQKQVASKKKNGTITTSKIEEQFATYLIDNNYKFERQYHSELYPFNCDFYLNDFDLYIELNGHWSHNHHPFDINNELDVIRLNEMQNKKYMHPAYKNAITVWVKRDPLKLKTAKENNLNYLVIYSNDINEVINQFENYINKKK